MKVALAAQIDKNYNFQYTQKQIAQFDKDKPEFMGDPHKLLRMCLRDSFVKVNQDIV